jgi:predicted phosphodiesterase
MVRRLRGSQGVRNRTVTQTEADERDEFDPRKQYTLPKGVKELGDWGAEEVDTPGWWLVMSDIHVPFHDATVIRKCVSEAKKSKIAGVLLNGDLMDCFAVSHWQKDPRKRDFAKELRTTQEFLGWIRQQFPKARMIYKHGNHDERYQLWMELKAPELLDIPEFDLAEISHASRHGYETVKDKRPVKLGKLWTLHGHEYARTPFGPVNPARGLFMRAKVSAMCGHLHQTSQHSESDLSGELVSCWSTGAMCDLHPLYAPLNKWNHGDAMVHVGLHGEYEVNNRRVVDGKVWQ